MKYNFTHLLIKENITIKEAMKQLDDTACKVLYVIDNHNRLIGALTDGDIRRGLLNSITLDSPVASVMNKNPKFIMQPELVDDTKVLLLMYNVGSSLPVLNRNNVIIDIIFWKDVFLRTGKLYKPKENKVFILAGGMGTRMEPFTKILPKPLIPLGEQPVLEKIMDKFTYYGFNEFVISVNYKAEMIKLYFSDQEVNCKYKSIEYVQEEIPLGTIGSLYLSKEMLEDSFFITNSDILIEEDLDNILQFHKAQNCILTVVGCLKNSIIPYGVLQSDDEGFLREIIEKPTYKHIINTGIYVAEPEIVNYLKQGERKDMTELINDLINDGKKISIYPIFEDRWFDVGQWVEYERTAKFFEKQL